MLSFLVAPTGASVVRQSLELHDRAARLRVWVDGSDVTGLLEDPSAPDIPQATPAAPMQDVEVAGLKQQLEEARAQLRQLDAQTGAAQRFLELLLHEIAQAQERHKRVTSTLEETTKTSQDNAAKVQDGAWKHSQAQLTQLYATETESVQKLNALAREALATLGLSAELQQAMRANLKPQTWRDTLTAAKDLVQVVVQGPVAMVANSVAQSMVSVSYTHLTLPTIYSV